MPAPDAARRKTPQAPLSGLRQGPMAANWRGVLTLYRKEVRRFLSIPGQSLLAPVVTTWLLYTVFEIALQRGEHLLLGLSFSVFLAPGLVMMAIIQNAFTNTCFSLLLAKIQDNIGDVLMPPLSPLELTAAYALGGATRGILVGLAVGGILWFLTGFTVPHPWLALYYAFAASLLLSTLGLIGGALSEKFDHIAGLLNFVIMPLAFLSGTFYTLEQLPPLLGQLTAVNPFFHLIDGFRYGLTGARDLHSGNSSLIAAAACAVAFTIAWLIFRFGIRLKT